MSVTNAATTHKEIVVESSSKATNGVTDSIVGWGFNKDGKKEKLTFTDFKDTIKVKPDLGVIADLEIDANGKTVVGYTANDVV